MYHQIDDVTLNSEVPRLKEEVERLRGELEQCNERANSLEGSFNSAYADLSRHKHALEKARVALEDERSEIIAGGRQNVEERKMHNFNQAIATINEVLGE